jgi:Flp pilus assembly protein TadD
MGASTGIACKAALRHALVPLLCALVGACSVNQAGYGVGPQAERAALQQQSARDPAPDTPGMYLALIDRMQARGLYYASLAHIDAYDKQYGASPDSILLRADALRATDQTAASVAEYTKLLNTPLAARAYRGLGLLAGSGGDFHMAAEALDHAAQLAPTDASTLSDLGYARLRAGDIAGARVPLLKAAELDNHNLKIIGNVALYLNADGQGKRAQALMNEQKLSPAVRLRIRDETVKVLAAAGNLPAPPRDQGTPPIASVRNSVPVEPLLQRFSQ